MTPSPIPKVLSTFLKHNVKALLIGGQACILYGAAEFSRDIDLAVMISPENLDDIREALEELEAEQVYYPDLTEEVLFKGHACHFRCQREDVKNLRIDLIGVMRGVDAFPELWKRRQEINLPEVGNVSVIGLSDLVKAKKTQRDKDWPMIRRLVEADIYNTTGVPPDEKICFWFSECRTPELLLTLAEKYPEISAHMCEDRPLLRYVSRGGLDELERRIKEEEECERKADKQYWKPLREELESWRLKKSS